jgi:hypothetical protein
MSLAGIHSTVTPQNSDLTELKHPTPDLEYTATADMTGFQVMVWLFNNIDSSKWNINSKVVLASMVASVRAISPTFSFIALQMTGYGTQTGAYSIYLYRSSTETHWCEGTNDAPSGVKLGAGSKIQVFY